jgi:internalin A
MTRPTRRRLRLVASVSVTAGAAFAGYLLLHRPEPQPQAELPRRSWAERGFAVGWSRPDGFGWWAENPGRHWQHGPEEPIRGYQARAETTEEDLRNLHDEAEPFGLEFRNVKITDAGLKELAGLRHLVTLNLGGTAITDAGLPALAGLTNLRNLRLSGTKITDAGMKELASLKSLDMLIMDDTAITHVGIKELAPLKNLRWLVVPDQSVTDQTLRTLREMNMLHIIPSAFPQGGLKRNTPEDIFAFDLYGTAVTEDGFKELVYFKNLHSLEIRPESKITDRTLAALREANLLHTLLIAKGQHESRPTKADEIISIDLEATSVTNAGLKELAGLKNLTNLNVLHYRVNDETLATLRKHALLHALQLATTTGGGQRPTNRDEVGGFELAGSQLVTDAGLRELADFKNLTTLQLNAQPADAAMKTLREIGLLHAMTYAKAKNDTRPTKPADVVTVDLRGNRITDAGLKHLADFTNLTSLNIGLSEVTDAGLKELAVFANLTELAMLGAAVTDEGLKELARHKKLTTLNLCVTRVTDAGLKELAQFKNLTKLNLVGTPTTKAAIEELRKAMPKCEIEW